MDRGSSGVVTLVACWLECICTGVVALGVVAVRYRWVLDVLTPLSDCRQESVKKMERIILGVRICIGWICTTGLCVVGFVCSFYFSVSIFQLPRPGVPRPNGLFSGYQAEDHHTPPIPYGYHAEGYHARTDTVKLTGYQVCRVTTCLLYTSPSPRDLSTSRMPSSA